jgi:hypothetical protein
MKGDIITAWEQYLYAKFKDCTLDFYPTKDIRGYFKGIDLYTRKNFASKFTAYAQQCRADAEFVVEKMNSNYFFSSISSQELQRSLPFELWYLTQSVYTVASSVWYGRYTDSVTKLPIIYLKISLQRVIEKNIYPSDTLFTEECLKGVVLI